MERAPGRAGNRPRVGIPSGDGGLRECSLGPPDGGQAWGPRAQHVGRATGDSARPPELTQAFTSTCTPSPMPDLPHAQPEPLEPSRLFLHTLNRIVFSSPQLLTLA